MPVISYKPVLTEVGRQKIDDAIENQTNIVFKEIALGDAEGDYNYNPTSDMTSLKNELTRIRVRSISFDTHLFYGEVVVRIFGMLLPSNATEMTIRECGIYDTDGDLILICRTSEMSTKSPEALRTGLKIKVSKRLKSDSKLLLRVDGVDNHEVLTTEELEGHTTQSLNIHRTTKEQINLGNVANIADGDLPVSDLMWNMIEDTKISTGFIDRLGHKLHSANNILTLIINYPTGVYKRGKHYSLKNNASINLGYQPEWEEMDGNGNPTGIIHPAIPAASGEFFICLDVVTNKLYIEENPDILNDILVAYVICNTEQGIISINDERHLASKNLHWYKIQELRNKISWLNGGDLNLTLNSDTNINFNVSSPIMMANKDIVYNIIHQDSPESDYEQDLTNMFPPVLYLNNNTEIKFAVSETIPWLNSNNTLLYNNIEAGALLEVDDNKYINYLIIYTADVDTPVKMIVGNVVYSTELSASLAENEFNIILDRIRCKAAYKITLHKESGYVANIARTKVVKIINLADNTSLRNAMTPKNHNDLGDSRFDDDQHGIENIEGLADIIKTVGKIQSVSTSGNLSSDSIIENDIAIINNWQADTRNINTGKIQKSVVLMDFFGSLGATESQYYFSTLAPNGKIYAVPHNASQVLELDPIDKTTVSIGNSYSGITKWTGIALGLNGKVYAAPYAAGQVLEVDPINKTTSLIGTSYSTTIRKWCGEGAVTTDGKIYFSPADASQVLELDPETKVTTLIGSSYGNAENKWYGACLAPNGKIYCAPYNATQVLEIDPVTKTTKTIGSNYGTTTGKWLSPILAPNGKIYCAPYSATQVLEIDPALGTTNLVGGTVTGRYSSILTPDNNILFFNAVGNNYVIKFNPDTKESIAVGSLLTNNYVAVTKTEDNKIYSLSLSASSKILEVSFYNYVTSDAVMFFSPIGTDYATPTVLKWSNGSLANDGKIYCTPWDHGQVLEINPVTKATALIGTNYGSSTGGNGSKWSPSCTAPNGKIYAAPCFASQVLEIDPVNKTTSLIGTNYGTSTYKWGELVLAKNGKLYSAPIASVAQILEVNPETKTTALVGTNLGTSANGRWLSGCLANNGKIYFFPLTTVTKIIEFTPETGNTILIDSVGIGYYGAVLAPNGKIYCTPSSAGRVMEFNPETRESILIGDDFGTSDGYKWLGSGCLAPNGKIYCMPWRKPYILEIDPEERTTRLVGPDYGAINAIDKFWGAVLAPNGKLYCTPRGIGQVVEIDIYPKSTDFGSYLLSGQLKI